MMESVVITGASAGIGRATADALVRQGYHVINLDRAPCVAESIETVSVDLRDTATLTTLLEDLAGRHRITGLVNNAGFARTASLDDTDEPLLSDTFALNLTVPALCARILAPHMKARGYGRIINISSRSALGRELRTASAASKGGIISMTRVWAIELARFGITANCVAPGPITTELFDRMNPEGSERRAHMVGDIPAGRMGRPEEVAAAVAFFLSREAGFVNGQTLYVCGGLSAGKAML